ncbi:MAG: RagB/SusD family nutrient uptake outer membrane protein [Phocaeicola sp.]
MTIKNNIIKGLAGAALLLSLGSCDNFLTHIQQGEPSVDNFWKVEADAVAAANGLYFWTAIEGVTGRGFMWYEHCSDDMVTGRPQSGGANIKNFILDNTRDVKKTWPIMYQLIKKCNDIIKNVPSMEISEKVKNETLGQAYFLRAWAYFWLAPYYGDNGINGGIPIVTEETLWENIDQPRTASVQENYLFSIADFEKAAQLLPSFQGWGEDEYGRPHRTAALAYAAKVALYQAQYDEKYYNKVVELCDQVIPHHALLSNYADVFTVQNNFSSEYIWSWTSTEIDGSKLPGVMLENKGWGLYNGWGYFMPTLELYNEFEEGDARRETTILAPGDTFTFLGQERTYYSTESASGMQFNKYMDPFRPANAIGTTVNPNGDNMTTDLSIPIIRFAEVLLWKAEALIWQGKNGDEPLNQVRMRAGLAPKTNATKEDLKHERRCELAGELTGRHLDLVRWGDAQATYAKPLHGFKTTLTSDGSNVTIDKVEVVQVWDARQFNPQRNHVMPIPIDEIASSKNLIQNKGY